jgi:hypothetical protein
MLDAEIVAVSPASVCSVGRDCCGSGAGSPRRKGPALNNRRSRTSIGISMFPRDYVDHYNDFRLNSAVGYITPKDMLAGHQQEIQADRDRKLEAAREQRKNCRRRAA